MKSKRPGLSAAVLLLWACTTPTLKLDPIGPASSQPTKPADKGVLIVYSAYAQPLRSGGLAEGREHSNYRIFAQDESAGEIVRNQSGPTGQDPKTVPLKPGHYRVVALVNGYGLVTIPVVITLNATAYVHLEGGYFWPDMAAINASDPVRLPDGQIVGWRAITTQ